MNYKYYKVRMYQNEFSHGFNSFVKDDDKFSLVFSNYSEKLKIEIYKKYNNMGLIDNKHFNYIVVNIEGEKIEKESLNLIFSEYLIKNDIKSRKIMGSSIYLIFVVVKNHKLNDVLREFIATGFHMSKKGKYDRYVTIPVVFEESSENLYIGCYPGNKIDSKWFGKEMIIWILEELQKNKIEFSEISMVRSSKKENLARNTSDYECIYTRNIVLELEREKKYLYLFILILIYLICRLFTIDIILCILPCILIIRCFYVLIFHINGKQSFSKFKKIMLGSSNIVAIKEKINNILEKHYKKYLKSFVFIGKYMTIDLDRLFLDSQSHYIILLDDFYEQDLLDIINKKNDKDKKRFLILKCEDHEYLTFMKDDNLSMKKKFLKIIGRLL